MTVPLKSTKVNKSQKTAENKPNWKPPTKLNTWISIVEITDTMHKLTPLLYSYMLAPTWFGSSLPSSGSFWICLTYVKIQIDMVVYKPAVVQICALCWLFLLHLLMHSTNIKISSQQNSIFGNNMHSKQSIMGHSMSSEPMKKPSQLWFYSHLVDLKYHGRYEKLQIFIIVYVVVFHL
jgi:hypothetical protein